LDPLELAALRLALDEQPSEDLPAIATEALVRGLDSQALREAAGTPSADVRDARGHFIDALEELGYSIPGEEEAVWRLVRHTAEQIVQGDITPYDGASWIWRSAYRRVEHEGDLRIFVGLASEWEDNPEYRDQYDEDIVDEARTLLARQHPRRWVKVMADYECWPLWDPNPPKNLDPEELPISEPLRLDLTSWAAAFDQTLNRSDPASSGFASTHDAEHFVAQGRALVERLQGELGEAWHVEYMPAPTHPDHRR
jgi:hypothetical protein